MNISSLCYATLVKVTDENLKTALKDFGTSSVNENNYQISVANNVITVTLNGETYLINYDLTDNPTFTYKVPITNDISKDDFDDVKDKLSIVMLGYVAVANIQGVSFEDSYAYFVASSLMNALSNLSSSNLSYWIVPDDAAIEGSNEDVIHESEFGNYIMDYINSLSNTKQTFIDGEDVEGINSFIWTTEETDITGTSCNLQSTLTVNLDADFSKLNGYYNKMVDSFANGITEASTNNSDIGFTKTNEDTTTTKTILPKTGNNETLFILSIFMILILAIIFRSKIKKYKDIK
jgi:LPXTG-motif cell wall-anchored protein